MSTTADNQFADALTTRFLGDARVHPLLTAVAGQLDAELAGIGLSLSVLDDELTLEHIPYCKQYVLSATLWDLGRGQSWPVRLELNSADDKDLPGHCELIVRRTLGAPSVTGSHALPDVLWSTRQLPPDQRDCPERRASERWAQLMAWHETDCLSRLRGWVARLDEEWRP